MVIIWAVWVFNARTVILPGEPSVLTVPTITMPAPSRLPIETAGSLLTSPLEIPFPPHLVKPRPVHNGESPSLLWRRTSGILRHYFYQLGAYRRSRVMQFGLYALIQTSRT
jgi:hypothetical protein